MLAPEAQALEQQIAEIDGVQSLQPILIGGVELAALAVGEGAGFARRDLGGSEAAILPAVDEARELARRPALLVDILGLDDLLHQADLVVGAEDREVRAQADELRVAAQDLGADRMERPEPLHSLGHRADEGCDALLHLPRGLVGEGHREDLVGMGLSGRDEMGDAGGENARLAGAGAGENEDRTLGRFDRRALFGVEARKITALRCDCGAGALAQASGMRGVGQVVRRSVVGIGALQGAIHRADHGPKGERRRGSDALAPQPPRRRALRPAPDAPYGA